MLLGVIADDFTGATDIAGFLVESGMRTVQLNGVPTEPLKDDVDAVVISLKSRSCACDKAIADSVAALHWLQAHGCEQFYFKYCSTFDSTAQGNIGPVTDALLDELGETFTLVCPALPINGRTVYNGYLFVYQDMLSDSGMQHHPVTPMTESNVMKMMNAQAHGSTGLVNFQVIEQGAAAVKAQLSELQKQGHRYAVVDAFNADHLSTLGEAAQSMKLVTGGSGLAAYLAKNWRNTMTPASDAQEIGYPRKASTVVLSGSCSAMTNQQVAHYKQSAPHFGIEIERCLHDQHYANDVAHWVVDNLHGEWAPMVYATAAPSELKMIQSEYGTQAASHAIEQFFSQLAHILQENGIQNFIVAGGETSGVVTQSLQVNGFHIGPQIAPGVPWVKALESELCLALKSGNFGDRHFFEKAQGFYHD
ncbi:MAG: 3-oxo-tetronate kinase [Vibrio sp.]